MPKRRWNRRNGSISLETFLEIDKILILSTQNLAFSTTLSQFYRNWTNMEFWMLLVVIIHKLHRKKEKSCWTFFELHELILQNKVPNRTHSESSRQSSEPSRRILIPRLRRVVYRSVILSFTNYEKLLNKVIVCSLFYTTLSFPYYSSDSPTQQLELQYGERGLVK